MHNAVHNAAHNAACLVFFYKRIGVSAMNRANARQILCGSRALSAAEIFWVNNTAHNVDNNDEMDMIDDRKERDVKLAQLIERFEDQFDFDEYCDNGGILSYWRASKICGYYDYEYFIGYSE